MRTRSQTGEIKVFCHHICVVIVGAIEVGLGMFEDNRCRYRVWGNNLLLLLKLLETTSFEVRRECIGWMARRGRRRRFDHGVIVRLR